MVRRTQPRCWLCGYRIDLSLDRQRHPLASSIDEVVPVALGGSTVDLANLRHAHRFCNSFRQHRPVTPELRRLLLEALVARGFLRSSKPSGPSRTW